MANVSGQCQVLIVLTPILPGGAPALREVLDRLPLGAESPLARGGATHFARWVILDQLVYEGPPQKRDLLKSAYLLFTSHFDGALDAYLDDLCALLPLELDAIYRHCVGYPGLHTPAPFKAWLRRDQIDANSYFASYGEASVAQVRTALELRERLLRFAVRAQRLDAAALQEAYRNTFDGDAREARERPLSTTAQER